MISNNVTSIATYILDRFEVRSVTIYCEDAFIHIGDRLFVENISDILPISEIDFSDWNRDDRYEPNSFHFKRSVSGRTGLYVVYTDKDPDYHLISV